MRVRTSHDGKTGRKGNKPRRTMRQKDTTGQGREVRNDGKRRS